MEETEERKEQKQVFFVCLFILFVLFVWCLYGSGSIVVALIGLRSLITFIGFSVLYVKFIDWYYPRFDYKRATKGKKFLYWLCFCIGLILSYVIMFAGTSNCKDTENSETYMEMLDDEL